MKVKGEEGEEKFEESDECMEWRGYAETLRSLGRRLKEIENAKDIKVACYNKKFLNHMYTFLLCLTV